MSAISVDKVSQDSQLPNSGTVVSLNPPSKNNAKQIHFIHVAQSHKLPFGSPSSEVFEEVIQSQLKIAEIIRKYPNCLVLDEQLDETMTIDDVPGGVRRGVKWLFPTGLRGTIQKLNSLQKEFLYQEGATLTMLYRGEISILYKAIHSEVNERVEKQLSEVENKTPLEFTSEEREALCSTREKELIECAKEAVLQQPGDSQKVTILGIFGASHNLKPHCEAAGFSHELIKTVESTQPSAPMTIPLSGQIINSPSTEPQS